jgi:methylase of polypeptide subunit release factors
MLSGFDHKQFDIICANLPYVPEGLVTSPEITKEPELALFSGTDGLDHYRRLFGELTDLEAQYVLTESLDSQHEAIVQLAHAAGYRLKSTDILIQCFEKVTE